MKILTEDVNFRQELPYMIRKFYQFKTEYPVHFHDDIYELTLTLGCEGTRIVGDSIRGFSDPDLVLIPPGLPHSWYNHARDPEGASIPAVIVVHFRKELIPQSWLQSVEFAGVRNLLDHAKRGLSFPRKVTDNLKSRFLSLDENRNETNLLTLIRLLNQLGKTDSFSSLSLGINEIKGKNRERELFTRIHEYILDNYRQKLRISMVAGIAGMSDSAFSHYFRKRTLKSFTDYIAELRLAYSDQLLIHSELSVTQIAFESGFESISSFNRTYRKIRGRTPGSIRKEIPGRLKRK